MDTVITQEYLKELGWVKDTTCPDGVNRWNSSDDFNMYAGGWYTSITFKDKEGTIPDYGMANFHTSPHGYIIKHRSFVRDKEKNRTKINYKFLHEKYIYGYMTVEELRKLMDLDN